MFWFSARFDPGGRFQYASDMIFRLPILFLSFHLLAGVALAEKNPYALPGRRRPRIRSYDQRPVPIRSGSLEADATPSASSDTPELSPEAIRNFGLSADNQFGFAQVTEIPVMGSSMEDREEEDVSESVSLFNPLDFMDDDDLLFDLEAEEDEDPDAERTPVNWDALEEALMREELDADEASEFRGQEEEEQEDTFAERDSSTSREPVETGLGLSNVLSTDAVPDFGAETTGPDTDPRISSAEDAPNGGGERPVLRMDPPGETVRTPSRNPDDFGVDTDERPTLTGSRRLFDEVRERWEPSGPGLESGSREPAGVSNPVREFPSVSPSRFEPAVSSFPVSGSLPQPERRTPDSIRESPRGRNESRSGPGFQRDDGRIRSLIRAQP